LSRAKPRSLSLFWAGRGAAGMLARAREETHDAEDEPDPDGHESEHGAEADRIDLHLRIERVTDKRGEAARDHER